MYLHQLVTNEDLIIDDNKNFSFEAHLSLSKKIIEQSNKYIKDILSKPKKFKSRLPYIDFIFLSEEEKEEYCSLNNIGYVRNFNDREINVNNIKINNNIKQNIGFNQSDTLYKDKKNDLENLKDFDLIKNNVNIKKYLDPFELYNIFKDSINHILFSMPFFDNIKNISLKILEYNYFKNNLLNKGIDINKVLEGCLDCLKDIV